MWQNYLREPMVHQIVLAPTVSLVRKNLFTN